MRFPNSPNGQVIMLYERFPILRKIRRIQNTIRHAARFS
jgi:hypothetical protein